MAYKFLPHTADVKILVTGKNLEEAFKDSVFALKDTILDFEKFKVKPLIKKQIKVEEKDYEALLYSFLEEIIYLLDAEDFLVSKVKKIKIDKEKNLLKLNAEILGDKASKYKFTNKVKAITYNEMFVKVRKEKCIIQFVLDV